MREAVLSAAICLVISWSSVAADDDLRNAALGVRQMIAHRGSSAVRPELTRAALLHAIASGASAAEVDVRTTRDGHLVLLHDATLDRTTNGSGKINDATLAEVRKLDGGSWFDVRYAGEKVLTLDEALKLCRGKIDIMLDLKESGPAFDEAVATQVREFGEPRGTIIGARSVEQVRRFRKMLPMARQLGLIPDQDSIEAFAQAGVKVIRLWPRWVNENATLVQRVRKAGAGLHLGGSSGKPQEIIPLLKHRPRSLSADDPAQLVKTLQMLAAGDE